MFCLPSIEKLSKNAERERKHREKLKTLPCDCCGKRFPKGAAGSFVEEWHDPFDDKPKGVITICPKCAEASEERTGYRYDIEGYFECDRCGKLHITNYSWERYDVVDEEEGERYCMKCAAKIYTNENSAAWLDEAGINRVTESIEAIQDYKPRHLSCIGSDKKLPEGVQSFRDTPEYEADGVNWFSKMEMGGYGSGSGLADIRECAAQALKHYKRVMIIIGEAGQFQLYMDVIVRTDERR